MPSFYISGTGEFSYQVDAPTAEDALGRFYDEVLEFHDTMTVLHQVDVEQVD